MVQRVFWQVDVFTTELYRGNPVAIVFDASGLTDETMQAIAREMNLSETVFVLPPSNRHADYKVRMFTPQSEMRFAGHPTIGTAFALVERDASIQTKVPGVIRQECGIGLVPIEVSPANDGHRLFVMTQASPEWRDVPVSREHAATMLGCCVDDVSDLPIQVVSTGVPWMIVPARSAAVVANLLPNLSEIDRVCRNLGAVGVTTFAVENDPVAPWVKVRTFAPGEGVPEDPVCGSGNGSVAAYIAATGLLGGSEFTYEARQGAEIARQGQVFVRCEATSDGLSVRVGGQAVKALDGNVFIKASSS